MEASFLTSHRLDHNVYHHLFKVGSHEVYVPMEFFIPEGTDPERYKEFDFFLYEARLCEGDQEISADIRELLRACILKNYPWDRTQTYMSYKEFSEVAVERRHKWNAGYYQKI